MIEIAALLVVAALAAPAVRRVRAGDVGDLEPRFRWGAVGGIARRSASGG